MINSGISMPSPIPLSRESLFTALSNTIPESLATTSEPQFHLKDDRILKDAQQLILTPKSATGAIGGGLKDIVSELELKFPSSRAGAIVKKAFLISLSKFIYFLAISLAHFLTDAHAPSSGANKSVVPWQKLLEVLREWNIKIIGYPLSYGLEPIGPHFNAAQTTLEVWNGILREMRKNTFAIVPMTAGEILFSHFVLALDSRFLRGAFLSEKFI